MKKVYIISFFCILPLLASAFWNNEHSYYITFNDGDICFPIKTCSWGVNWREITKTVHRPDGNLDDIAGTWEFCFNDDKYLQENLESCKKCNVEDELVSFRKQGSWGIGGMIVFKDVKFIEEIE